MSSVRTLVLACWVGALIGFARAQAPAGTLPTVIAAPADQTVVAGSTATAIDLSAVFGLPGVAGPLVQMHTILGNITIELYPQTAPVTVANFLQYVNGGLYNNTIINRSVVSPTPFVLQGGGFTVNSTTVPSVPAAVPVLGTIVNESKLSNVRGTLAMARTSDPNSASNQWFINLADNGGAPANLDTTTGGYAVFARVIGTGMTVADAIAGLKVYALDTGNFASTPLYNLPANATTVAFSNWVRIPSVSAVGIYPDGSGAASALGFGIASSNSAAVSATITGHTLYLTGGASGSAVITITASDASGNQASTSFNVLVAGIAQQPVSQTVAPGSTAVFAVGLTAAPPGAAYQWMLNGKAIGGATSPRLVINQATAANLGTYTCIISVAGGTLTSNPATLEIATVQDVGRLINLSVLTSDVTSAQSLTLGFVIGGNTASETLLLRASGPALQAFGVGHLLADPFLTLFNASSVPQASNVGWSSTAANQTAVTTANTATGAFALTPGSADSALVQVLSPGSGSAGYSIIIAGKAGDGGATLGEVFDDTPAGVFAAGATHLKNLSSRVALVPGDTLTAGFTIGGSTSKTVLIRAVGPALTPFGITSAMADPQLKLFAQGSTLLATNAGWGADPQIAAASALVGAFSLPAGGSDSVILITLAPGGYSAQVNSVSGAGGAAQVEVYELP